MEGGRLDGRNPDMQQAAVRQSGNSLRLPQVRELYKMESQKAIGRILYRLHPGKLQFQVNKSPILTY